MGVQEHIKNFGTENYRHLDKVRDLRRAAWADESLEPLERSVLALTGSAEQLAKFEDLARKIGSVIGQPVIEVLGRGEDKSQPIKEAKAGIISGEAYILSSNFDKTRGAGHMGLVIPVDSVISYIAANKYARRQDIFYTGADVHEHYVEAAHLVSCEWENKTRDPAKDYYEDRTRSMIGRAEIYSSELFGLGVSKVLLALEEHAASQAAVVL